MPGPKSLLLRQLHSLMVAASSDAAAIRPHQAVRMVRSALTMGLLSGSGVVIRVVPLVGI